MSQTRAAAEKELSALLISVGPNGPNRPQESAPRPLINFRCCGAIVERLRKTERDMLNPFSNSLWETENLNCDQCSVDGGLWKVTESVAHKPMLVRRLSVLHTIEQKQRPSI